MVEFIIQLETILIHGFAIYCLFYILLQKTLSSDKFLLIKEWDQMAILLFRVGGFIMLMFYLLEWYDSIKVGYVHEQLAFYHRALGSWWFTLFLFPLLHFGMTQFFWNIRLQQANGFRILIALFFLIFPSIDRLTILFTSLHRDYLPSYWTYHSGPFQVHLILYFIGFALLTTILVLVKRFRKKSMDGNV